MDASSTRSNCVDAFTKYGPLGTCLHTNFNCVQRVTDDHARDPGKRTHGHAVPEWVRVFRKEGGLFRLVAPVHLTLVEGFPSP